MAFPAATIRIGAPGPDGDGSVGIPWSKCIGYGISQDSPGRKGASDFSLRHLAGRSVGPGQVHIMDRRIAGVVDYGDSSSLASVAVHLQPRAVAYPKYGDTFRLLTGPLFLDRAQPRRLLTLHSQREDRCAQRAGGGDGCGHGGEGVCPVRVGHIVGWTGLNESREVKHAETGGQALLAS